VTDTGVGVRPDEQARLFERFFQADQTPTRAFSGSGLGLSICRELVRLMGGTIRMTSEPGQGSTFWFVLPLPAAPPAPVPTTTRPAAAAPPHDAAGPGVREAAPGRPVPDIVRGRRVLVVDDHEMNLKLMRLLIESLGCTVETATSGEAAVARIAATIGEAGGGGGAFDVVLMDYRMSSMDGAEATRRIREIEAPHGRRTPVIALTGDAMRETRDLCTAAGMDEFVVKPVDRHALATAIAGVLARTIHERTRAADRG